MTETAAAEARAAEGDGGAKKSRKRSRGKKRNRSGGEDEDARAEEQADKPRRGEDGVPADGPESKANVKARAPTHDEAHSSRSSNLSTGPPHDGPKLSFYERVNPHKPSARALPSASGARSYTISVALPGSIVLNAQTPELQARLAGQIARTCAIFNVDEIVVFDEGTSASNDFGTETGHTQYQYSNSRHRDEGGVDGERARKGFDPNAFLARILQYLETPQYLRKALFPMHHDLRLAGLLPPLDCPHHLRFQDRAPYREGVIVDGPYGFTDGPTSSHGHHDSPGSAKRRKHHHAQSEKGQSKVWVDVGLKGPIEVELPAASSSASRTGTTGAPAVGTRVTVRMGDDYARSSTLVSPREPIERAGLYWGYTVRLASSLAAALADAPALGGQGEGEGGYDLLIGTSERGVSLDALLSGMGQEGGLHPSASSTPAEQAATALRKPFRHAVIVLGGLSGLEDVVERDAALEAGADEASALFDVWLNLVENQGSRTIRTEEALMIALSRLRGLLDRLARGAPS